MARSAGIRFAGLTAVCALVGTAALPAAADAGAVQTYSVSQTTTVPAGATKALTLTCPKSAVALHGAPTTGGAYDSVPGMTSPRRWTFRFRADAEPRDGGAVLRCVRLKLPKGVDGIGLVVGTRWSQRLSVPPATTSGVSLACDRGQLPTGWGIERGSSPEAQGLSIAQASPTRRGFSFKVENTGAAEAAATLHVRCLQRANRATSHQRFNFRTRVATGARSCRSSEFSVSAGLSLDPLSTLTLTAAYPTGQRSGRWVLGGSGPPVATSLVCLSKASRFRPG